LGVVSWRLSGCDTAEILSRGGDGKVAIQTGSTMQKLKEGFHSLTVSHAATGAVRRIGFYEELLTLKLFRTYRRS